MRGFLVRVWNRIYFVSAIIRGVFLFGCATIIVGGYISMHMPGASYEGPLMPLTETENRLIPELKYDVLVLARRIGERHIAQGAKLKMTAEYIENTLSVAGYSVEMQPVPVEGEQHHNLIAELRGMEEPDLVTIVAAHYDSPEGSPGANDNASGTAAVLSLARHFATVQLSHTLRFVFFVNSEGPYSRTANSGSMVYAALCRERNENIQAMYNIESIGYYTESANSQSLPVPYSYWYPKTGNFVSFSGNTASIDLLHSAISSFRQTTRFPSKGITFPDSLLRITGSDEWSFLHHGYPALTITDTAPLRYPYHHQPEDTPDKLNYPYMARVVNGLSKVLEESGLRPTQVVSTGW